MPSNLDKYKDQLNKLVEFGVELLTDLLKAGDAAKKKRGKGQPVSKFGSYYEKWYSEALEVVRQLIPNRLEDFKDLYKRAKRKEITWESYTIADYKLGLVVTRLGDPVFDIHSAAFQKFQEQILILQSAEKRFESDLFDIKQIVQADIFDSEIDAGRELLKNGFLRAAGAVAGVVLEKHLEQVCANHNITVSKKNPGISDFNDLLKTSTIIDTITWRFIQRLGDLRNLCAHNKTREPSYQEVAELIDGTDKTTKTLY